MGWLVLRTLLLGPLLIAIAALALLAIGVWAAFRPLLERT
jgi:hypothetical protein